VPDLRGGLSPDAVARLSLRTLAEYWLRVWGEPRRKVVSSGKANDAALPLE
jgi:hypothetical protein